LGLTENGVLTIYRGGVFSSFSTPEGLRETISNIWADADGNPIIETRERHYYFHDGKFVPASEQKKPRERLIYYGKSGAMWIIEPRGITRRVRGGQETFYPLELKPEWLLDTKSYAPFFEDSRGAFWGTTVGNKFFRLQNGITTHFTEKEIPDLKDLGVSIFTEDAAGGVWFVLSSDRRTKIGRYKDERLTLFETNEALFIRGALIDRVSKQELNDFADGINYLAL